MEYTKYFFNTNEGFYLDCLGDRITEESVMALDELSAYRILKADYGPDVVHKVQLVKTEKVTLFEKNDRLKEVGESVKVSLGLGE